MAKKTTGRKKRKIAKHILRSAGRKKAEEAKASGEQSTTKINKKKKSLLHAKIKDPKEAHEYLSNWKYDSANWKFNKNTQSWLCRHMYDVDKVPKAVFSLLMEYIEGLKGFTRDWVNEDAVRRVLRYKAWEKKQNDDGDDNDEGNEEDTTKEDDEEKKEDDARFAALDDHDKRKEYKRSRQVVQAIKKAMEAEQQEAEDDE